MGKPGAEGVRRKCRDPPHCLASTPGAGATFYATILQLIKYGADYAGLPASIALQSACAKSLSLFPLSLFRLPFFTLPILSNLKRLLLWQMLYQIICQICAIPELNKVIRIGNLLNFVGELSRVWLLREVNMRVCHVTSRNFIFHADYAVVNLYHMGRTQRTTPNDLRFTDRNRCPEKLPKLTIALP